MKIRDILIENDDDTPRIKLSGSWANAESKKAVQDWIDKVYELYPHTWQNNHVMLWGEGEDQQMALFELVPSFTKSGAVEVKWFQAYPLRSGVGSRAMAELQRLAKEDDISLTLYPWDKGKVSQGALTKFYKKQGFKPTAKGSKNMQWTPDLDEAISLTHRLPAVKKALSAAVPSAIKSAFEHFEQVIGDVVRDDIFKERFNDILTTYLVRHIRTNLLEEFPEITKIQFASSDKYGGWVSGTTMTLNYDLITELQKTIYEAVYDYMVDSLYAKDNEIDPRRVDFDLTKMAKESGNIFKYSRKSSELSNTIKKWASLIIHELVHVHQHTAQAHRPEGKTEYRSYLTKNRKEFYKAVENLSNAYEKKLYSASPQEILAFAHNAAVDIIELATDGADIDEVYDPNYLMSMLESFGWGLRDLQSSQYDTFNQPGDQKHFMVYKRFVKQTYQEVMRFAEKVKERIEYLNSQPSDELDEGTQSATLKLRDARKILSDAGYELVRSSGGHEQWKHPSIVGSNFTLPVHPSKELSVNVTQNLRKLARNT